MAWMEVSMVKELYLAFLIHLHSNNPELNHNCLAAQSICGIRTTIHQIQLCKYCEGALAYKVDVVIVIEVILI